MNSFAKIARLEAQIVIDKLQRDAEYKSFKEKFDALEKKIDLLLEVLETLKTMGKVATYFEKAVVFVGKVSIAVGFMYAVYKFGLSEIAEKVRHTMGGTPR